jgi:D-alanine--D-alanine ligase
MCQNLLDSLKIGCRKNKRTSVVAKLTIAVVYGGSSREHDISMMSGKAVLNAIDRRKYTVIPVEITRDNVWVINHKHYNQRAAIKFLKTGIDFVFIALHGTFGEDGQLQRILEKAKIAFSGSGSKASHLAMCKSDASLVMKNHGLCVPSEQILDISDSYSPNEILKAFTLPLIVKPVAQGSSFGVSKVTEIAQLNPAIQSAFKEDNRILIQEYIQGEEVSVGVLEDDIGTLMALPPTQLMPVSADFFDYHAKYTHGAIHEVTPPPFEDAVIKNIQSIAIRVHALLGCSGYSRTDMILRENKLYVIEINTLPGLTDVSILPQQAKVAGMSFTRLIDRIIKSGLRNSSV